MATCIFRSTKLASLFLNSGINKKYFEPVALFAAIELQQHGVLKLLIDAGVDVNLPSSWGRSPLYQAVNDGDLMAVHQLLDAGADIYALCNRPMRTIIESSIDCRRLDILNILLQAAEKNKNLLMLQYPRALRLAYRTGQRALVRFLQAHQKKKFPDWSGETDEQILSDISNEKKDMKYLEEMGIYEPGESDLEEEENSTGELPTDMEYTDYETNQDMEINNIDDGTVPMEMRIIQLSESDLEEEEQTVQAQRNETTALADVEEVLTDTDDTCSETDDELRELIDDTICGLSRYY